jgi:hypothetical protein
MGEVPHMNEREKNLLNTIGKNPDISIRELQTRTHYKWKSTVAKKLEHFKEQNMLFGPSYVVDYGKICKNPLHCVSCILETKKSPEILISYLKMVEPLLLIFPVLSPHKKVLDAVFLSSDDAAVLDIMQLLKDHDIITDYVARRCYTKCLIENPDLFGDVTPSLDNLQEVCDTPDLFLGYHDTDWNACDIAVLPYLLRSFKGVKLMDILKKEKNMGNTWSYEQIKYSRKKMLEHGLIEKVYAVAPFPPHTCACFSLYLKTDDLGLTTRIIYNFARGARIFKEYMLYEDWGVVMCYSHPSFLPNLMNKLDKIEEIKEKEMYHIRSNPPTKYWVRNHVDLKYFDVDAQTLEYPYQVYEEKIKEALERGGSSHVQAASDNAAVT